MNKLARLSTLITLWFSLAVCNGLSVAHAQDRSVEAARASASDRFGGDLVPVDILWAIDTSVSMAGEIAEIKLRIADLDAALVANGVDARYGLVRFGSNEVLIQDITNSQRL